MQHKNSDLLPFDLEIERTLKNIRRSNSKQWNMDKNQGDRNTDAYNEGHSDQNEMRGLREPTLGICWRPMLNENYSGIRW